MGYCVVLGVMSAVSVYQLDQLFTKVQAALAADTKLPTCGAPPWSLAQLAALDEFHIGGRHLTKLLLAQLAITAQDQVLDVGCGLGGAARYCAQHYHCAVTGVDLTADYVRLGHWLNQLTGTDNVRLLQANAVHLPFNPQQFDVAYMFHVGMNIDDKSELFKELARVIKRDGHLLIYDVMRLNQQNLSYPLPWVEQAEHDFCANKKHYLHALTEAGFHLIAEQDYRILAIELLQQVEATLASSTELPSIGLHLLLGDNAQIKRANLLNLLRQSTLAPTMLLLKII